MKKGDIILLSFPFTDLKGKKIRPALVLVVSDLDVIVAFITTQFKWQNPFDILLEPNDSNGLKKTSLLRLSKITTIDKDLILGKLGELNAFDIEIINTNLLKILNL
ncbi:type II toxin-antitoxin system PemK/MazF family toxin [Flavobacterium alvei]|uniref:type II toxin-antitoxin system PemK/MazF family toxin n=1 Tax=Flavobacterium alvei TaxID=2080416 RepID=UPI0026E9594E|nr:type II toxin-antitoxin system PemK/MazF family toxin [Flavobacterium alvei]